jgi:putative endonuclease
VVRGSAGTVGQTAEQFAKRFLVDRGLDFVAGNYRCRHGEIDLVMRDGACLVFVEVRYRSGRRITSAGFTVDRHKQRKLIRTAARFLASRRRYYNAVTRFDVVGIDREPDGSQHVQWIRDAFRPQDAAF